MVRTIAGLAGYAEVGLKQMTKANSMGGRDGVDGQVRFAMSFLISDQKGGNSDSGFIRIYLFRKLAL